ncbi:MAG: hypothetical protein SGILL_004197, partial [Bacillariaceae sp.]
STMSMAEKSYELPGLNRSVDESAKSSSVNNSSSSSDEDGRSNEISRASSEATPKSPVKKVPIRLKKEQAAAATARSRTPPKRQSPLVSPPKSPAKKRPLNKPPKSPAQKRPPAPSPRTHLKKKKTPRLRIGRTASKSSNSSGSSSSSSSVKEPYAVEELESRRLARKGSSNSDPKERSPPSAPKSPLKPVAAIEIPSSSDSSFSISTNTDSSLAAKLASAGIATLPAAPGERRVSFDQNASKDDVEEDEEESDSYESYETASSDEFETDTEGNDPDGSGIPAPIIEEDSEEYETDTTYEREVVGGEAPVPRRPRSASNVRSSAAATASATPMSKPSKYQPVSPKKEPTGEKPRGKRQPYVNIPPLIDADTRRINPTTSRSVDSDEAKQKDEANLLGLSGWENGNAAPEEEIIFEQEGSNHDSDEQQKTGMLGWLFGAKQKKQRSPKGATPPARKKSDTRLASEPVYDPPEFDDGISQVTDRVFFPKQPKASNPPPRRDPDPNFPQMTPSELEQEIQEEAQRFSIRSFRRKNEYHSPALEDLNPVSVLAAAGDSEPRPSEPEKEKRNTKYALAALPVLSVPKDNEHANAVGTTRQGSPDNVKTALLDMKNESVDLDIDYDLDKPVPEFAEAPVDPNLTNAILMQEALAAIPEDEDKNMEDEYYDYTVEESVEEVEYEGDDVIVEEEFVEEEEVLEDDDDPERPREIVLTEEKDVVSETDSERFRKRSILFCIGLLVVLALIGVGIYLILRFVVWNERDSTAPGPAPVPPPDAGPSWGETPPALPPISDPTSPEEVERDIVETLSPYLPDGGENFDDPNSPQSQAVEWMSQDEQVYSYDGEKLATRYALATLYFSTNGDDWANNDLWLSDQDECLWYSEVSDPCSGGRYAQLRLGDNNLRGFLPEEMSLLSNSLSAMDLGGILVNEIPFTIGELRLMTSLRLRGSELSGSLPDSMALLSNLSYLDLRRNRLQGSISAEFFGAIVNMGTLDLGENQFAGSLPASIGSLSNALVWLSVGGNQINGPIPEALGDNTLLRYLNLDSNDFTSLPEAINRLTNLEILSAGNNRFGGELPESIGDQLTNLEALYLNNNAHKGKIPASYGSLTSLTTGLDLSGNQLTGELPESLGQVSAVRSLNLRDNQLNGTVPLAMGAMSMLDTLRLDANNFVGELPQALCDSFDEATSSYYADCRELSCPCCNFCCNDATGECTCRFANSQPILCIP